MKPKNFKKKLTLNKVTISDLSKFTKQNIKAGFTPETIVSIFSCVDSCSAGEGCTAETCTQDPGCNTLMSCVMVPPLC